MALYLTLTPRLDGGNGPMSLSDIDAGFCALLGVQVDPEKYVASWFDVIGLRLACGQSVDSIRRNLITNLAEDLQRDTDVKYWLTTVRWLVILQAIDDLYIVNCWYAR